MKIAVNLFHIPGIYGSKRENECEFYLTYLGSICTTECAYVYIYINFSECTLHSSYLCSWKRKTN